MPFLPTQKDQQVLIFLICSPESLLVSLMEPLPIYKSEAKTIQKS